LARPPKIGLDYFPLQTDIGSDPKIIKMIRKGGKDAWTIFTWILILTYKDGFYTTKENVVETILWMFRDIEEERIEECIGIMIDADILDKESYEKGIITSHGIQSQYRDITKRREVHSKTGLWLLNTETELLYTETQQKPSYCIQKPHNNGINVYKSTQTETETEKETENKTETETESKADDGNGSDSETDSDSFSPLIKSLIGRLKAEGLDVKPNTVEWLKWVVVKYEKSFINDTVEEAIAKYRDGTIYNPVGYIRSKFDDASYTIPFTEPKPKRKKPDPDCPICHGEGGFFRKTILNGVEGAGEWVQCECTKPMPEAKEM
jgi:hypothetical protein